MNSGGSSKISELTSSVTSLATWIASRPPEEFPETTRPEAVAGIAVHRPSPSWHDENRLMITVSDALDRLRGAVRSGTLAQVCRNRRVDLLVMFGSALNRSDPGDIDLAVAFEPGGRSDLLGLIDDLAEIIPGDHLDVMNLDRASPVALHRALSSPEVLYSTSRSAFSERQIYAIVNYIDTAHLRDDLLESLAR